MPAYNTIQHFRLENHVSIVTGGSRGLGRVIAEALAGAGSNLVLTGRQSETLRRVAAEIDLTTPSDMSESSR